MARPVRFPVPRPQLPVAASPARRARFEPRLEQSELGQRAAPDDVIVESGEKCDQAGNFPAGFDLWRQEASVVQDAVGAADRFGYKPVVVKEERLAGAGEMVAEHTLVAPGVVTQAISHLGTSTGILSAQERYQETPI